MTAAEFGAREAHAKTVLDEHEDDSNPAVGELVEHRYALVEHTSRYGRDYVSGHDSIEDALARAGEGVLEEDSWWPKLLVDLDSGETLADEDESGFHVVAHVTIGEDAIEPSKALDESLADLRAECHYSDEGGFDDDGNDLGSVDALIGYKDALEERLYALAAKGVVA